MKLAGAVLLGVSLLAGTTAAQTASAPPEPPVVMLVAVYHFDNPGRDVVNLQSDDVRAPARQAEIAALTDQFARFAPTVVAVEETAEDAALTSRFWADYRAGRRSDSRNERDQLGFRLAERLDARVVAIDFDQPLPFGPLMQAAQATAPELQAQLMAEAQGLADGVNAALASGTIADALLTLNTPDALRRNDALYYIPMAVSADQGRTFPGVDVAAAWYERNMHICARLLTTLQPGEHAIVFYGAGHIPQLAQCLTRVGVRLEDPIPYLSAAR